MYVLLINSISELIPLDNPDKELVMKHFKPLHIKKDTILVDIGDYSNQAYFINSGYLRYYKNLESGEEQTIHLFSQGNFATAFCSFACNIKSEEVLHSISDAELLCVSKSELEKIYESDMKWQKFGRILMESFLLEKEKRIIDQISLNAQERYIKLLETNPNLIQNVPIQYLASFIGIKPESLSRIRKQIFLTNVRQ
jgi:CRP/FNR family transcriptional regulator, anaerobic regulatory protein